MVRLTKPKPTDPKYKGLSKPTSGYFQFASDNRDRVMKELKIEMGAEFKIQAVPRVLSTKWREEVDDEQKKKYEENYKKAKEVYDVKFAEWKTTPEYKDFVIDCAKYMKQKKMKAIQKEAKACGQPSRVINPYSVFCDSIRTRVIEELKGALNPGQKFRLVMVGKKLAADWKNIPEEEKLTWKQKSDELKTVGAKAMEDWLASEPGVKYKNDVQKVQAAYDRALGKKPMKSAKIKKGGEGEGEDEEVDPLNEIEEELENDMEDDEEEEEEEGEAGGVEEEE